MATLKAAVIGTGFIGPAHIEALRRNSGVDIVALASRDVPRARELAEQFSIPRVYDGWQECVRDRQVDVIHNCTPNNLHFAINKAALLAGKHVVSEKPLTMTAKESKELVALAAKAGTVTAVNFNYRFYPVVQHARGMVHRGAIGDVFLVHGHYLQDWLLYPSDYNWRVDTRTGGASRAVSDIGSHWCDLVQFVTGLKIRSVYADLMTVHPKRKRPAASVATFKGKEQPRARKAQEVTVATEDAAVVLLRFAGGARGACTISQVSAGRKNREWFEIDGSKQAIGWDQEEPNSLWIGHRDEPNELLIKDPSLLDENARKYAHYPGGHPEGYPDGPMNLFAEVYAFIRSGRDPRTSAAPFPTFADGHWENRVVEAILTSSRTGRWVDINAR